MKLFGTLLLLSISFVRPGNALQTTPGSTCAAFCLDDPESDPLDPASSNTKPRDITCTDDSYENSQTGIKFKNCLNCLQKSNATTDTENDASWFLYNVRYSVDVCLFGFPEASKAVSSPCTINWACQPLKTALEAGKLDPTRDQFEYCSADGNFTASRNLNDCIKCFGSSANQGYMANFITALKAGCQQMPAPGELIGLSGPLFQDSLVQIIAPAVQDSSDKKDTGFGITSTGALVGITLGGALLFFGGIALFWVYHRRQKRIFEGLFDSQDNPRSGGNKSITPPPHIGSLEAEKRGPSQMSDYELRAQKNYTNNAAYYEMLEKEMQSNRQNYVTDANNARPSHHTVLPTHPAYLPQTQSRQSSRGQSPQPPNPRKTNKPDSYALQAYLQAAEDANALGLHPPPPPPGPPPVAVIGDQSRFRGPSPPRYPSHSRDSSMDSRGPSPDRRPLLNLSLQSAAGTLNPPPPPPPPPAQASKVPSLAFPSVSRIRIPKRYTPPKITVQNATPVDGPSEQGHSSYLRSQQQANMSIDQGISRPMFSQEQPRFEESHWERRRQPPPPLPLVVEQSAIDRRPKPWVMNEAQVKTGTSSMYG